MQQGKGSQPRGDKGNSHENSNGISVVPDFTPALSIYPVPGGAGRTLARALARPGPEGLCLVIGESPSQHPGEYARFQTSYKDKHQTIRSAKKLAISAAL